MLSKIEFSQNIESGLKTPHNIEVVLYRVFLELLNNTIKHSGASQVKISIAFSSEMTSFIYIDNGSGFEPSHALSKSGIGLRNMESRVTSLGGKIEFTYDNLEMITAITIPS